eukprot:2043319-Rhodomonas_salina.1
MRFLVFAFAVSATRLRFAPRTLSSLQRFRARDLSLTAFNGFGHVTSQGSSCAPRHSAARHACSGADPRDPT